MQPSLESGLYELVINAYVSSALAQDQGAIVECVPIEYSDGPRIFSSYLSEVIRKGLEKISLKTKDTKDQIELVNRTVQVIYEMTEDQEFFLLGVEEGAQKLHSFLVKEDQEKYPSLKLVRPETSVAHSSLFNGNRYEPQMWSELKKEIKTADRIDLLVSFIKWSGLRLIIQDLKEFSDRGGHIRVITTSYMGATDIKAIDELSTLNNVELKISYETKRTRLHAKAYMFFRKTGFSTAYVGSSNLSNIAISEGLEWNLKVTEKELSDVYQKINRTFESYWHSNEFETYDASQRARLDAAIKAERRSQVLEPDEYILDVHPYPYQQEILDKLAAERNIHKHQRNLLVAATGTGKTVISALDYRNFRLENTLENSRLLFVAHREEILRKSLETFRQVLKEPSFGCLNVGSSTTEDFDHLFMSIQSFNSQGFTEKVSREYYDFIIIDEFHHACAKSYQKLLEYFSPKVLLGLTATPERMDGQDILQYFDGRVAAEIRLPEAIERKLLCPFQYFGVEDTVDLSQLTWTRGKYDSATLSNLFSFERGVAEKRAQHIAKSLHKYVTDVDEVVGFGFCVSVEHAKFMADQFNLMGIPSLAVHGNTAEQIRKQAIQDLTSGKMRFIFSVDLYNEGVDVPELNTVLFLRPTESLTVFLQQLGRGLRLSPGKECLTVLDFIGQANSKYSFEEKFEALLARSGSSVKREIERGFTGVPTGCYIQLEEKPAQYILDNIRTWTSTKRSLLTRIRSFEEESGKSLTLSNFLDYHNLDIRSIYSKYSFYQLCAEAGVRENPLEPATEFIRKSFPRFIYLDSRRLINYIRDLTGNIHELNIGELSPLDRRLFQMFHVTVWGDTINNWESSQLTQRTEFLKQSPGVLEELKDILDLLYEEIDFIDEPIDLGFESPLDLHCTYTRDQLLVGLDFLKPGTVREGVKWLPEKKLDVFFVTLNKKEGEYSETTMYEDYAIDEWFFHWQSQSTTAETSPTGQRYINHRSEGSQVLLFVRENRSDRYGITSPYTFLGTAQYVKHEGNRPMSIIWKLDSKLPQKYLRKTQKYMIA